MRNLSTFAFFVFLFNTLTFSQSLTSDGDYDVSSTTFPGFIRAGVTDVHSPTSTVVYVYHEADASGQGVFCKIFNEQMTMLVTQFQVNENTTNTQTNVFVKVNEPDNSFLVMWSSNHSGNYDVYMRKYDMYGNALTGEVLVNDANSGTQYASRVAFDYTRNEAVVMFRDDAAQDGSGIGVYAKRFNYSNLNAIGSQFRINQAITSSNQVPGDIGINQSTEELIVLWRSNHGGNYDIYKSVFTYNGSNYVSSAEAKINVYSSGDQYYEYLSINQTTGQYVTVWGSGGGDGSGWAVFSQIYNANHTLAKSEFQVNSDSPQNQTQPKAIWVESVNQIVYFFHYMYSGFSTVKYRIFDGKTTPGQFTAVANDADAIGGANTYTLWAWSHYGVHYNSYDQKFFLCYDLYNSNWTNDSRIKARKFTFSHPDLNPASTTLSAAIDYNISSTNFPGYARLGAVDVDHSTGRVITIYQENDANGQGVFCKIFDKYMNLLVDAFQINENASGLQYNKMLKVHQAGNSFIVAWTSTHTGNYEVFMRKFDLSGNALSPEIQVNDVNAGTQHLPICDFDYNRNELIVVFRDETNMDGGSNGNIGVFAKRFNYSDLSQIGQQFQINQTVDKNQVLADMGIIQNTGELLVTYMSDHIGSQYDVYKVVFDYNSLTGFYESPVETRVNNYTASLQNAQVISINQTTGDYLISWGSYGGDGSQEALFSKIYNSNHQVIKNDFRVNSNPVNGQHIPKVIWKENIDNIIFFFNQIQGGVFSTLKYRIFSKNSEGNYLPVCNDQDAIGGQDIANDYYTGLSVAYNPYEQSLYLSYDIFNGYEYDSKVRLRKYSLESPLLENICLEADGNMNWAHVSHFDENGLVISEERTYVDRLGKELQTQSRNIVEDNILAQTTIYDALGNPVINTLPAPINRNCFMYQSDFITEKNSSEPYDYDHFDQPITGSNLSGEVNNPDQVANISQGTLGWYYSSNNSLEPYTPTGSYPYSRVYSNYEMGGNYTKVSGPADALRMGQGHEASSVTVPILWELNHYLALRKHFIPGNAGESIVSDFTNKGSKRISKDENGVETVSFFDKNGKLLATAMSGEGSSSEEIQNAQSNFDHSYRFTFYTCSGTCSNYFYLSGSGNVEIYVNGDFSDPYYIGPVSGAPTGSTAFPNNTDVFIHSSTAFTVTRSGVNYNSSAWNDGVYFKDYLDIHIPKGKESTISISGTYYEVYDLTTGLLVSYTPGYLPAGYYRVKSTYSIHDVKVKYTLNYYDFTYYYYDDSGRLIANVSPKGVNLASASSPDYTSEYEYNTLGWTLAAVTPDEGRTEYVYRKDGNLRFSQDALQLTNNRFSYISYDNIGRVTEAGEYHTGLSGTNSLKFQDVIEIYNNDPVSGYLSVSTVLESIDGIDDARCFDVAITQYDEPEDLSSVISGYTQKLVNAEVAKSVRKETGTGPVVSRSWYSYDEYGQLEWMVQEITGLGVKTVDYTYDLLGNVTEVSYQKNTATERFDHVYTYDQMKRLKKVETKIGNGSLTEQAEYYYYLHGPLKRKEIDGDLQGIDYTYTIGGNLKAVNHPYLDDSDPGRDSYEGVNNGFERDVFGMMLEYYDNDYVRGTYFQTTSNLTSSNYDQQFNGTIRSCTWNTYHPSTWPMTPAQYIYEYDRKYQMSYAKFGEHSTSTNQFSSSNNNYTWGLAYDPNGNIVSRYYYDDNGVMIDESYGYAAGKNQLTSTYDWITFATNRTFTYNSIGQMDGNTSTVGTEGNKYVDYDSDGLVTAVYTDINRSQPKVKFIYNEAGERIKKITFNSSFNEIKYTWYVRDASGNILSIYETDVPTAETVQKEVPVYGAERLGVLYKDSPDEYNYELTDHLGNVRATIRRYNGSLDVLSYSDYYPFGSLIPDRSIVTSPAYRNGYQGQFAEKDEETGWDAFDLRMYEANLGRWFAPDPYGQYHSPYLAMGNSPVNNLDPDGGWNWSAAAVGAGVGAAVGAAYGLASGKDNWKMFALGGAVAGFAVGGLLVPSSAPPVKSPRYSHGKLANGWTPPYDLGNFFVSQGAKTMWCVFACSEWLSTYFGSPKTMAEYAYSHNNSYEDKGVFNSEFHSYYRKRFTGGGLALNQNTIFNALIDKKPISVSISGVSYEDGQGMKYEHNIIIKGVQQKIKNGNVKKTRYLIMDPAGRMKTISPKALGRKAKHARLISGVK